jgi:hypothetical protein
MEVTMETIVYRPDSGRRTGKQIMGIAFIVIGVVVGLLLFCGGGAALILLLTIGLVQALPVVIPVMLLGALVCPVFVGLGLLFRRKAGEEARIELTPDRLIYVEGEETTSMNLEEIRAVEGIWNPGRWSTHWQTIDNAHHYPGYWTVVIRDEREQEIRLDMPVPGLMVPFDVVPTLRDLLPRLPDSAYVDPYVVDLAATGETVAPEKNPRVEP